MLRCYWSKIQKLLGFFQFLPPIVRNICVKSTLFKSSPFKCWTKTLLITLYSLKQYHHLCINHTQKTNLQNDDISSNGYCYRNTEYWTWQIYRSISTLRRFFYKHPALVQVTTNLRFLCGTRWSNFMFTRIGHWPLLYSIMSSVPCSSKWSFPFRLSKQDWVLQESGIILLDACL